MVSSPQNYYYPQGYMPVQQPAYRPKTSVDSVRIDIVNPKASLEPTGMAGGYPNQPQYNPPYYYPNYNPQNIYNNYNPNINATNPATQQQPQQPPTQQPQQTPPQNQPQQQQPQDPKTDPKKNEPPKTDPKKEPDKKPEPPKGTGNIPDELIKEIDRALSDPNVEIRISGATKLVSLFEKNPEAANHPALTVLLNRMLKDPHQNVRLFGEIAMQVGAKGDAETKDTLQKLSVSDTAFGADALAARKILMDMTTNQSQQQTAENPTENPQPEGTQENTEEAHQAENEEAEAQGMQNPQNEMATAVNQKVKPGNITMPGNNQSAQQIPHMIRNVGATSMGPEKPVAQTPVTYTPQMNQIWNQSPGNMNQTNMNPNGRLNLRG